MQQRKTIAASLDKVASATRDLQRQEEDEKLQQLVVIANTDSQESLKGLNDHSAPRQSKDLVHRSSKTTKRRRNASSLLKDRDSPTISDEIIIRKSSLKQKKASRMNLQMALVQGVPVTSEGRGKVLASPVAERRTHSPRQKKESRILNSSIQHQDIAIGTVPVNYTH